VLWVTTADKAALVACGALNWLDAVVSFEKLLRDCGTPHEVLTRLGVQYKEEWVSAVRTKVRLGLMSVSGSYISMARQSAPEG
jgi:hypothetical protein